MGDWIQESNLVLSGRDCVLQEFAIIVAKNLYRLPKVQLNEGSDEGSAILRENWRKLCEV